MIVTKEQKERMIYAYLKDHTAVECVSFVEGVNAALELVDRILKSEKDEERGNK